MSTEYSEEDRIPLQDQWYLALDLGTGLSACLLNRNTQKLYPIFWKAKTTLLSDREEIPGDREVTFRLPSQVNDQKKPNGLGEFKNFISYLNIAIPYIRISQDSASEVSQVPVPLIQLSDNQTVFLGKFQRALQLLLSTLTPYPQKQFKGLILPQFYTAEAVGLDLKTLHWAMQRLAGVIVGFPSVATEAYRFNIEKAIVDANLVKRPEQVFWLENAIAIFLDQFRDGETISMSGEGVLAIDAGATTTEIALVEVSDHIDNLQNSDFFCHSWAYGGDALDLDIICQLLLNSPTGKRLQSQMFGDEDLIWPVAGSPDLQLRYRLRQRLQSQPLGVALLDAAKSVKIVLPQQQQYTLEVEGYTWELNFSDLERLVLAPFIHGLNGQLNHTLAIAGISSIGINQAFCVGGNGGWTALNRWLRQKLPNAVISQNDSTNDGVDSRSKSHLQVAMGLASLPLYPQVLDRSRHQYRDSFLLKELLNCFDGRSLSVDGVMQVLESRGINTRSCQKRILSILKDQFPLGLVPQDPEMVLIHPASRQTPDYQNLCDGKLFVEDEDHLYHLNLERADVVRQYLNQLFSGYLQSLEEPAVTLL
ncbi:hypothetical protein ACL6C3_02805 [Capilliphycus salinus ALCB114379]|uniref:hypothetical protein n=1 Tax=Capilliphycus salinus TaxID=2768948 RepID=UPI0039A4EA50